MTGPLFIKLYIIQFISLVKGWRSDADAKRFLPRSHGVCRVTAMTHPLSGKHRYPFCIVQIHAFRLQNLPTYPEFFVLCKHNIMSLLSRVKSFPNNADFQQRFRY
jgi:hypothetical protein